VEVHDANVSELRRAGDKGVEEHGRRCARAVQVDVIPGMDPGDRFGRGDDPHE
jgi:hypothetical protein